MPLLTATITLLALIVGYYTGKFILGPCFRLLAAHWRQHRAIVELAVEAGVPKGTQAMDEFVAGYRHAMGLWQDVTPSQARGIYRDALAFHDHDPNPFCLGMAYGIWHKTEMFGAWVPPSYVPAS